MQIEMLTPDTIEKKLSVYTANLHDENINIVFRENFAVFFSGLTPKKVKA